MATYLYHIRKENLNQQLYLLVKAVMMIRSVKAYRNYKPEFPEEEHLHIKELSDQLQYEYAYLVFPSLHKSFRLLPQDITKYPAIIAVFKDKCLKEFYTLDDKEKVDGGGWMFTNHPVNDIDEDIPVFCDYFMDMIAAMDDVLDLMTGLQLDENDWYKRLVLSYNMLVEGEDGICILHNAGLFDFDALVDTLLSVSIDKQKTTDVLNSYGNSLRMFAMYAVNMGYNKTNNCQNNTPKKPIVRQDAKQNKYVEPIRTVIKQTPSEDEIKVKEIESYITEQIKHEDTDKNKEVIREKNNRRIIKNIVLYSGIILLFVGLLILAKYWLVGSVTISVGVFSAIIIRTIHHLKEGYEPSDSQPVWFRNLLLFTGIFSIFGGLVLCKKNSEQIYSLTNGGVTPWGLFAIVSILMVFLFLYSFIKKKSKRGKEARIYIFLMLISICFIIAQCGGSLTHNSNIEQEEWQKSIEDVDSLEYEYY